jgi:hypothetical protein
MGDITYQGNSPFRVIAARGSTARVSDRGVEMTVYAAVDGKDPGDVQIQVPMTPAQASRLAAELIEAAAEARRRG